MIPHIDAHYRTQPEANGRFTTGHSSGGWSSLWLQINYPETFGGCWSTSPDPVDFRDYQQVDLYADPPLSLYYDPQGEMRPIAARDRAIFVVREVRPHGRRDRPRRAASIFRGRVQSLGRGWDAEEAGIVRPVGSIRPWPRSGRNTTFASFSSAWTSRAKAGRQAAHHDRRARYVLPGRGRCGGLATSLAGSGATHRSRSCRAKDTPTCRHRGHGATNLPRNDGTLRKTHPDG